MGRIKINRKKALFGADGAISAAATIAAAAMQTAASMKAAKQQSDAIAANAATEAKALDAQNANNNKLQSDMIAAMKQENQETRNMQKDLQAAIQMQAGQESINEKNIAAKKVVKYGGGTKSKKTSLRGSSPFSVTDGGGAIPIDIDNNGYGLYEIYGNDHDHYHKTKSGKYKSGVGIKLPTGEVIEAEGNQNTSKGEKMYITPDNALFLSKHNIKGFNPSNAVDNGMHPEEAFAIQENIKSKNGLKDNGKKAALGTAVSNLWKDYKSPMIKTGGNLIAGGLNVLGNTLAASRLGRAYTKTSNMIANAYRNLKTLDLDILDEDTFNQGKAIGVVRTPDVNINPQLERARRNAAYERNNVNNSTLSSAARQQRLAGINDRELQRESELYNEKYQLDEQIKQHNANTLTEVSKVNAELLMREKEDHLKEQIELGKYNTDIVNAGILGEAQNKAEGLMNKATTWAQTHIANADAMGSAVTNSANAFADTIAANEKYRKDYLATLSGYDTEHQINAIIMSDDKEMAKRYYNAYKNVDTEAGREIRAKLEDYLGYKPSGTTTTTNSSNSSNLTGYQPLTYKDLGFNSENEYRIYNNNRFNAYNSLSPSEKAKANNLINNINDLGIRSAFASNYANSLIRGNSLTDITVPSLPGIMSNRVRTRRINSVTPFHK